MWVTFLINFHFQVVRTVLQPWDVICTQSAELPARGGAVVVLSQGEQTKNIIFTKSIISAASALMNVKLK